MASAAQIEANRLNAAASTGPTSPEGKARSSRNHLKLGLFSTQNCVRPEEVGEYARLSKALWKELAPRGPVEEMLAVEIVRTAWRLQRCATAEAQDGNSSGTQTAVDRARASAHSSLRRLLQDLRQFQSDRWLRAEVLNADTDRSQLGIADTHRVMKGLADNERLKSLFFQSPVGIDPINRNAPPAELAPTIRTQSAEPLVSPPPPMVGVPCNPQNRAHQGGAFDAPQIPRNAPCPCHSGLKYKRCCGAAAPPLLNGPAAPVSLSAES
jgi:hypothetical protein